MPNRLGRGVPSPEGGEARSERGRGRPRNYPKEPQLEHLLAASHAPRSSGRSFYRGRDRGRSIGKEEEEGMVAMYVQTTQICCPIILMN